MDGKTRVLPERSSGWSVCAASMHLHCCLCGARAEAGHKAHDSPRSSRRASCFSAFRLHWPNAPKLSVRVLAQPTFSPQSGATMASLPRKQAACRHESANTSSRRSSAPEPAAASISRSTNFPDARSLSNSNRFLFFSYHRTIKTVFPEEQAVYSRARTP